jgi:hypothetical protein
VTTTLRSGEEPAGDASGRAPVPRLRWWHEVVLVLAFYAVYTAVRNRFGSAAVLPEHAFENARRIIDLESHLGLFFEARLQQMVDWHPFLVFWNTWYGTLHFVVTIGTLVLLFRWFPAAYRRARNILATTTSLALVGYSLFPLMPPRLLCDCAFGSGPEGAPYGFVDTLARHGGLWTFGSTPVQAVSNQYAAMPSLHVAWALWCVATLWPVLGGLRPRRRRAWRGVLVGYAGCTGFAIIVTGNHFWLDVVGGAATLGLGWLGGSMITKAIERWRRGPGREDLSAVMVSSDGQGVP